MATCDQIRWELFEVRFISFNYISFNLFSLIILYKFKFVLLAFYY